MKLSEIKNALKTIDTLHFRLPNGTLVPRHFHVTEVGAIQKHFIDCGGVVRKEDKVSFQLWEANDYDHRLHPEKLVHIIELAEKQLSLSDQEVEVEYQGETIGKFGLDFSNNEFNLTSKQTACLALDNCGIPQEKEKVNLDSLQQQEVSCCAPTSNCC